jgi:hypothetical protein
VSGSLLALTTTPTGPRPVSTRWPYQSSSNRLSRASVAPVISGRCWTPSRTVSLNRLSKSRVQSEQITYVSTPSVGSPHARHGKREAVISTRLPDERCLRAADDLADRSRHRSRSAAPLGARRTRQDRGWNGGRRSPCRLRRVRSRSRGLEPGEPLDPLRWQFTPLPGTVSACQHKSYWRIDLQGCTRVTDCRCSSSEI